MKVATLTVYKHIQDRAEYTSNALNEAIDTVTSGRKIKKLSDDPFRLALMLDTRAELADIDQFERNLEMGAAWLSSTEESLRKVQDRLADLQVSALAMLNDSYNKSDRELAAISAEEVINDIVQVTNTDVNGRYIYSGTRTNAEPFVFMNNKGEIVDVSEATRVTYRGDNQPFKIQTQNDEELDVGSDGSEIYGNMYDTLLKLRDAFRNNDVDAIEEQLDPLKAHQEHISAENSVVGFRITRLQFRQSVLDGVDITTQQKLANLEEVDMTEAISDLSIKELMYQASLSASSKVINMKTLMDYI
ncbi:flagellar hook-associated protein 3 FlgL [Candidatus Magnetomorum sp. HK-1]|nr:flagellar hook-associated protein 3 FlgL [Candidatus Magnetomorum sp. HK-1]